MVSERESTISLGAMTGEKKTTKRDRKVRKKYMGDLKLGLVIMVVILSRFTNRVIRFMIRNMTENSFHSFGFCVRIKTMNYVTFLFTISLMGEP